MKHKIQNRTCPTCKEPFTTSYQTPYCPPCTRAYSRKWRNKNIEKAREKERLQKRNPRNTANNRLTYLFGITLEEKEQLLREQDYKCATCLTTDPGKVGWNTDHNHQTGNVRGILCSSCNISLGRLKDNIDTLKRMVDYLQKDLSPKPLSLVS